MNIQKKPRVETGPMTRLIQESNHISIVPKQTGQKTLMWQL